jgi:hypothetical protein
MKRLTCILAALALVMLTYIPAQDEFKGTLQRDQTWASGPKTQNKSVDTFSLRVFGEITASLEVTFSPGRNIGSGLRRASVASSRQASTDAESARFRRPQVIVTQPHRFLITPLHDSSS